MVFDPFSTFVLFGRFSCAVWPSEQTLNESKRFGTFLNASIKQVFGYFEQIYESVQKMT